MQYACSCIIGTIEESEEIKTGNIVYIFQSKVVVGS